MIKAVIFDMDGVLVETELEYIRKFEEVFVSLQIPFVTEEFYQLVGVSWNHSAEVLERIGKGFYSGEDLLKISYDYMDKEPLNYKDIATKNMMELLKALKEKGYLIGVASASANKEISLALNETGFIEFVDTFHSGMDCEINKPNPEVYLTVMSQLGISADECIVLEDSFSGINAAKAAGAYTVARKDNRFSIDQSRADTSVVDVYELLDIVVNYK